MTSPGPHDASAPASAGRELAFRRGVGAVAQVASPAVKGDCLTGDAGGSDSEPPPGVTPPVLRLAGGPLAIDAATTIRAQRDAHGATVQSPSRC